MKKINWKMVVMVIFVAVSTLIGIYFMEEEFIEWMSGLMWMLGELTIVGIVFMKDFCKFMKDLCKEMADM